MLRPISDSKVAHQRPRKSKTILAGLGSLTLWGSSCRGVLSLGRMVEGGMKKTSLKLKTFQLEKR